jgi:hypothetical protein
MPPESTGYSAEEGDYVTARRAPAFLQAVLHLMAIYLVARAIVPWLLERVNDTELYFASHMVLFGFFAGIGAGFVNGRLWRHWISRFVWVMPVLLLTVGIIGSGPQVYFHSVSLPVGKLTPSDFKNLTLTVELVRMQMQFRLVVPTATGIAYSLGALLSGLLEIPIPEVCLKIDRARLRHNLPKPS